MLKETPWRDIVSIIRDIIDKMIDFIGPSSQDFDQIDDDGGGDKPPIPVIPEQRLTPRKLQVLWHIGDGKPSKLIARELKIETRTVEGHRSSIWRKLKIKSQRQRIIIATEYRRRHKKPDSNDGNA